MRFLISQRNGCIHGGACHRCNTTVKIIKRFEIALIGQILDCSRKLKMLCLIGNCSIKAIVAIAFEEIVISQISLRLQINTGTNAKTPECCLLKSVVCP